MSASLQRVYAALPHTARGIPVHLGGDPKGKNFIYTNGNSVIIRDIANPAIAETYAEHATTATVARYAPSGFYIASADESGKIRIWDTTQKEHLLKYEYRVLSGAIKDLVWSDDSKRIAACGEGRDKYGVVIMWDSGSSVGEITGHSKCINSIDMKQTRPYRIVTGGEDFQTSFFEGPPFKFKKGDKDHTRFVNCVRFSPDGNRYLTVGSDYKGFFYDGKTGDKMAELGGGNAHTGSIMSCSWSADSKQVLTASADKTAKLWDVEKNVAVSTFTFGDSIDDQQMGCLWQGSHLLTVSLSGYINYLDVNNPSKPLRILKGHNKNITALSIDNDNKTFFTGSYDGRVAAWDVANGSNEVFSGNGHTNQVSSLSVQGDQLVSVGMDDAIRFTPSSKREYTGDKISAETTPVGLGLGKTLSVVPCLQEVIVLRGGKKVSSFKADWDPLSAAVSPSETEVAIGNKEGKIRIYSVSGDSLTEKRQLSANGAVNDIAYSPDGKMLASGDSGRAVLVWDTSSWEQTQSGWLFHNAKVNSVAWTSDSKHIASGGLDTSIFIWSLEKPSKRINIKGAHPAGVSRVAWLSNDTVLSTGQDCCTKSWSITHH
eukprot:Opistho-1_new@61875